MDLAVAGLVTSLVLFVGVEKCWSGDVYTSSNHQVPFAVAGCYVNCGYDSTAAYNNCNGPSVELDHSHEGVSDTADKLAIMYMNYSTVHVLYF